MASFAVKASLASLRRSPACPLRVSRSAQTRRAISVGPCAMAKEIIATDKAPEALGPYSQAVKVG